MSKIVEIEASVEAKYENLPVELIIDELYRVICSSELFNEPLKISIGRGAIATRFY